MDKRSYYTTPTFVITTLIGLFILVTTSNSSGFILSLVDQQIEQSHMAYADTITTIDRVRKSRGPKARHLETPDEVRAIYISSWVAGTPSLRKGLVSFIESSSINAVVIDIKDSTGYISFDVNHPLIDNLATDSARVPDMISFIDDLHDRNIYVIGRLTAFQDPLLSKKKPEWSFDRIDTGETWTDRKGLSFINPRYEGAWNYLATVAEASYAIGFDEINVDYIRYPSDGNISNIDYGLEKGETRRDVMKRFYTYLDNRLRKEQGIPISADIFGLTTSAEDDLGIGQYLEDIYPHFDAIAPMVYPSHYSSGFFGHQNPNAYPYEVVKAAMSSAIKRASAINEDPDKLRTWIQDFSLGTPSYGVGEVRAQIQATYDAGLDSYMVWDPKNRYTRSAYTN